MIKMIINRVQRTISIGGWMLIIIGSITWSLTMVKSGLIYTFGMGFWGPNGHDGVWHIALANSLSKGSWEVPIFAGEQIENYHIGFDLLLSWLHKFTFIPVHNLYFQIVPPILAFFTGIFCYRFVRVWRKSKIQAFWATFFVYFGGSLGWIVTYFRSGRIDGESLFWSQQSISTLVNPPFALSLVLIFVGLYYLTKGLRQRNRKFLTIATFIFGILVQIKVYSGILTLFGLFASGLRQIVKRKGISLIKVATGALIISILIFSPVTRDVDSTVVFKPFWFLETMMAVSDRVAWPRFYEAMINYKFGNIWIKGFMAYSTAFGIFVLGNFGARLISLKWFYSHIKNIKGVGFVDTILTTIITLGILFPLFFVQSGTPWNTIQFMYYSLIFSGVVAGVVFGEWMERKIKKDGTSIYHPRLLIPLVSMIIITLPTTFGTLSNHYLPLRPPAKIPLEELEALNFLNNQPSGVVLAYPYDEISAQIAETNPPRPLYLYESTAYVSAFSNQTVYLEDEVNLNITGYNWPERRKSVLEFYNSLDHELVWNYLRENNITYIYWVSGQRAKLGEDQLGIERIFENDLVSIFKVN